MSNQGARHSWYGTSPIKDVLFVKGLKHNLLSIRQLNDNNYDIIFNKKT